MTDMDIWLRRMVCFGWMNEENVLLREEGTKCSVKACADRFLFYVNL